MDESFEGVALSGRRVRDRRGPEAQKVVGHGAPNHICPGFSTWGNFFILLSVVTLLYR